MNHKQFFVLALLLISIGILVTSAGQGYDVEKVGNELIIDTADFAVRIPHTTDFNSNVGYIFADFIIKKDGVLQNVKVENLQSGLNDKESGQYEVVTRTVPTYNIQDLNVSCDSVDEQKYTCTRSFEADVNKTKVNYLQQCKQIFYPQKLCNITQGELVGSKQEKYLKFIPTTKTKSYSVKAGQKLRIGFKFLTTKGGKLKFDFSFYYDAKKYIIDPFINSTDLINGDFNTTGIRSGGFYEDYFDGNISILNELDWNTSKTYPQDYDINLIGYWKLNDNNGTHTLDDTNKDNDGLLVNNMDTNELGLWDKNSVGADGFDDYVNIPRSSTMQRIVSSGTYTIETWVKADTLLAGAGRLEVLGIGDWSSDSEDQELHINIDWGNFCGNDNFMSVTHRSNGVWNSACSSTALVVGRWYHVAARYDGSNLCIVLDGVQSCTGSVAVPATGTGNQSCDTTPLHWALGRGGCRALFFWDGLIEDVRFYDKDLGLNQIVRDHNSWFKSDYTSEIFDVNTSVDWNAIQIIEDVNYGGAQRDEPTSDVNLVGYWTFDEGDTNNGAQGDSNVGWAIDLTSNNNDGKFINGSDNNATGIWDNQNSAGFFDGVNDYVHISQNILVGTSSMSSCAWFNTTVSGSSIAVVAFGDGGTEVHRFVWYVRSVDDKIAAFVRSGGAETQSSIGEFGPTVNDGAWHHGCFIRDTSGGNILFYLDGVEISGGVTDDSGDIQNTEVAVGFWRRGTGSWYFDGSIDEVKIYNRALTKEEVKLMYAQGVTDLKVQVRSCDDAACDGETFVGQDGTANTFFIQGNEFIELPAQVTNNRYFQYKTFFDTNSAWGYPFLIDVNVQYVVEPVVTFSDLRLYECNTSFTGSSIDLNISSDLNIVWDFNIQKATNDLNENSILVYYNITHEGEDENHFGWIRDEKQISWKIEDLDDISWSLVNTTGDFNRWRSSCEDDHAFKHWVYNLDPEEFETKDGNFLLDNSNDWLKQKFTTVRHDREEQPTDTNVFINISFSADGTNGKQLDVYICNDDYANPKTEPTTNCLVFPFDASDLKEKDAYYTIKSITASDANTLSGMNLNVDMNFWLYYNCNGCTASDFWTIDRDDTNSNIDSVRNWSSNTGVGNLIATDKTIDAHMHWQLLAADHNFNWIIQMSDNNGSDFNSSMQTELIESVNLPPIISQIVNPSSNTTFTGTIDVNITVFDPNSGDVLNCDINVLDVNGAVAAELGTDFNVINNNCGTTFDTTTVADGNYTIRVLAREINTSDLFQDDLNQELAWIINNINDAPTVTVLYPNDPLTFDNRLVSTIEISFKITDPDSTTFEVDLNYSTSSSQGTGTVIFNDENTSGSASISCAAGSFVSGRDCNVSWNIDAVSDNNYFILVSVTDGNTLVFDASDNDFNIFTSTVAVGAQIGTQDCETSTDVRFYLSQYLYITLSGFDSGGNRLNSGVFDLYLGTELLMNDQALTLMDTNFLQYIENKKINNDVYTVVISASDCLITKVIENN